MSFEAQSQSEEETPIERIFQKVMGRRMTAEERVMFHLKNGRPHVPENSKNGAGPDNKHHRKLTRH